MIEELLPDLRRQNPESLSAPDLPALRSIILLGDAPIPGTLGWEALLDAGRAVSDADVESRCSATDPDGTAFIMYTSGTTGFPKGAASSLRDMIGAPLAPGQHEFLDLRLAAVRSTLAEERSFSAWATGAALGPEQAISAALAECARVATNPSPHTTPRTAGQAQSLTQRESDVAALVAEGLTNVQIAQRLSVGERTVETHVSRALAKLELSTRTRLTAWAIENGLHAGTTLVQPV